ncbi:O-antigen ligase family protein [Arsenicicoccus dermatophilus]|uniref:O-antigen ligase family protein n=1 Tax=Arsenicicoccus dermatophilus TaxID=1076331 RepID=UPI003916D900
MPSTSTHLSGPTSVSDTPLSWAVLRDRVSRTLVVAAVALVVVDGVVGVLPSETLVELVTPLRALILVGLLGAAAGGRGLRAWRTPVDLPILLLVLATALSAWHSGQGWPLWRGLLTGVGAFYLSVALVRCQGAAWHGVTTAALLACAVAGLTACHQLAAHVDTGFCRAGLVAGRESCDDPEALIRATGTFANPNLLAAALVLLLPLAWAAARSLPTSSSRVAAYGVVAAGYVSVVATWSRAGLVAAAVGILVLLALRPGWSGRAMGLLGVVGAALAVVAVGGSVGVRQEVWRAALAATVAHPLGVGPGRGGAVIDAGVPGSERFRHAHDLWLNWLLECGWLGGIAVVLITVILFRVAARRARMGSAVARMAGAGLAGFATMSLVDHPANHAGISMLMWVVLGLVVGHQVRPGAGPRLQDRIRDRAEEPVAVDPVTAPPVSGPTRAAPVPPAAGQRADRPDGQALPPTPGTEEPDGVPTGEQGPPSRSSRHRQSRRRRRDL